jgi:LmbE family N-acetylglucosaminyl deacetylase
MLRRLRPDLVFTFDPEGSTQHPDHMAMSRFAMDGIAAAADARWYPELGAAHTVARVLWPCPQRAWELAKVVEPAPGLDYRIDIRRFRDAKEAALQAHRTQWPGLRKLFHGTPGALDWEGFRNAIGPQPKEIPASTIW